MYAGIIGKVDKAKKYSNETERINITNLRLIFRENTIFIKFPLTPVTGTVNASFLLLEEFVATRWRYSAF